MIKNIGLGITGSFCTHTEILKTIKQLSGKGYNIIPILSEVTSTKDTRFGKAEDFKNQLIEITGNNLILDIVDAEPIGPNNLIDIMVIAPCTGNTLSKLANAITDNAITMVTKSHLRNNKPVVIGISTNDALGLNLQNISKLITAKNIYFVPFGQDAPTKKPKSLISDLSLLEETILMAEKGIQIQPILLK